MSVRKRTWTTRKGEQKESWIVDYTDQNGERHIQTFDRKKDADDCHAAVKVDVGKGIHTAHSKSLSIAQAAENWIKYVELEKRERTTVVQYRNHVDNHINPRLGRERLAKLTTPRIQAFRDELLACIVTRTGEEGVDQPQVAAQGRATPWPRRAECCGQRLDQTRQSRQSKVEGWRRYSDPRRDQAHYPCGNRANAPIADCGDIHRPACPVSCAACAGMMLILKPRSFTSASGLTAIMRWASPNPKRASASFPLGPMVVNTLREWRLACPRGELGLALPNAMGKIWNHAGIVRAMCRTMVAAGVVDAEGEAKYTGLHSLRHFYASWCINRKADGGLELPAKSVQARMGHSSIVITMDTYGHLFPNTDDGSELAEAEKALLA